MATLTDIDVTLNVPDNFEITKDNFEILNTEKLESQITPLPPAQQGNAIRITNFVYLPFVDYNAIGVKDTSTLYFTEQGIYFGIIKVAGYNEVCS